MAFDPLSKSSKADEDTPLLHRLGWLVLIWIVSVSILGAIAWVLRLWIVP